MEGTMPGHLLKICNCAPVALVRGEDGENHLDRVACDAMAAMAA
jgi:hypothetical protein